MRRRYARVLENGGPFPDLIVIDGGKGQLNAAYAALEDRGPVEPGGRSAWRKKKSWCSRATAIEPIALDPHGAALRLLQRIRDEAHRFAITFHRQSRRKRDLRSELDAIPGIGAAAPQDAAHRVRQRPGRASRDTRRAPRVVGAKAASAVIEHFSQTA